MTISVHNATSLTCPICYTDYTDSEKKDVAKVVELACHHFYHISCLGAWLIRIEANRQDLCCCYCNQFFLPKKRPCNTFTLETLEASLKRIERNPDFQFDLYLLLCLARFRSLADSLLELLNNDFYPDNIPETIQKCSTWVRANIEEDLILIADELIAEIHNGGNALRTLQEEIKHYARIPYKRWPIEIKTLGIPVYHSVDGGSLFRMRVSKNYVERAVVDYLCANKRENKFHGNSILKNKSIFNLSVIIIGIFFLTKQIFDLNKNFFNKFQDGEMS